MKEYFKIIGIGIKVDPNFVNLLRLMQGVQPTVAMQPNFLINTQSSGNCMFNALNINNDYFVIMQNNHVPNAQQYFPNFNNNYSAMNRSANFRYSQPEMNPYDSGVNPFAMAVIAELLSDLIGDNAGNNGNLSKNISTVQRPSVPHKSRNVFSSIDNSKTNLTPPKMPKPEVTKQTKYLNRTNSDFNNLTTYNSKSVNNKPPVNIPKVKKFDANLDNLIKNTVNLYDDKINNLVKEGVISGKNEFTNLVKALIQQESAGDQNAVSKKSAIGLMQLLPTTAKELGVNPYDKADNVKGGVLYLLQQLKTFKDIPKALAAYNAGATKVKKYNGIPPYKETQDYVKIIMKYKQDLDLNS